MLEIFVAILRTLKVKLRLRSIRQYTFFKELKVRERERERRKREKEEREKEQELKIVEQVVVFLGARNK